MTIRCLITNQNHRDIAAKLGYSPVLITNIASCIISNRANRSTDDVTLKEVQDYIRQKDNKLLDEFLAIPNHDYSEYKSTKPLTSSTNTGYIFVARVTPEQFWKYSGDSFSIDTLKGVARDKLGENYEDKLKKILHSQETITKFLVWYEMSKIQNGNVKAPNKRNIEEALDKAIAYTKNNGAPTIDKLTNLLSSYFDDSVSNDDIYKDYPSLEGHEDLVEKFRQYIKNDKKFTEKEALELENYLSDKEINEATSVTDIITKSTPTGVEYKILFKNKPYTIQKQSDDNYKILDENGKEPFAKDSLPWNKVFANLAVLQGRAVVVTHKDRKYVVNNKGKIISVATGKLVWKEENETRKAILKVAEEKFKEKETQKNTSEVNNNINKETEYESTDEFKKVQDRVREDSKRKPKSVFNGDLSTDKRQNLADVLRRQLQTIDSFIQGGARLVENKKHGTSFKMHTKVNPKLFHDIFEIVRYYTPNGELVDLHDDYSNCKCYLSEDGTAGFAVEPDGNLVSVFNLGTTKGFLSAIKDLVKEAGATHLDAYASSKQDLQEIYKKTLGFHTAASMDYNMDYDHDSIAENHGKPKIVFMVNHEVKNPKHFDKDSYDEAQQYQLSQIKETEQKNTQNNTVLTFKPKEAEFYSGSAIGSDKAWEEAATKAGIKVINYTIKSWDDLSDEWKTKLDKEYQEVVSILGRKVLDINSYNGKLVRRDMMQADKADAIFAVGTIASNGYVDGGTGYATTRGIIRGIPVYIFNQSDNIWEVWDKEKNKFVPTSTPSLTKNAAVIGTRKLQDNGKEAINSLFGNQVSSSSATKTPVASFGETAPTSTINIWASTNEHANLSNLAKRPFTYTYKDGTEVRFQSVEQAFQYTKAIMAGDKDTADKILKEPNGYKIKELGRKVTGFKDIETEWNRHKDSFMRAFIKTSFKQNKEAARELLDTGNAILTHTQDTGYWGTKFPKILMEIREELRNNNNTPAVSLPSSFDTDTSDTDNPIILPGVDNVKTNTESAFVKAARAFTPKQRTDRVNLISRMFSEKINEALEDIPSQLEDRLSELQAKEETPEIRKQIYSILRALEAFKSNDITKQRQYTVQYLTFEGITQSILEDFKEMAESESDPILKQKWQDAVDNFDYLLSQSTYKIEQKESLKVSTIHKDRVEKDSDEILDNDRQDDDDDEFGNRSTGNDGWSFKIRMIDPHKTLSKLTKEILSNIPKLNRNGKDFEYDDLGNIKYLDDQYAHLVLLEELSSMIDDADFCIKEKREDGSTCYTFPALEKIKDKYPWVETVITTLNGNPSYVSAFYSDLRQDFIPYTASKEKVLENGSMEITNFPLNLSSGFESARNTFLDNYETGTIIMEDGENATYDENRKLNLKVIDEGIKTLSDVSTDIQEAEEDDKLDIAKRISKVVRTLGLPIHGGDILAIWKDSGSNKDILDVVRALSRILNTAKTLKEGDHLISANQTDFNILAKILGSISETDTMSTFRVAEKSYYSYSAPNYISTQIKSIKSDSRRTEYLHDEFQKFDFFYRDGKWKGSTGDKKCWLDMFETEETVRNELGTQDLLVIENIPYSDWDKFMITERFIFKYFSIPYDSGSRYQFGYYNFPIFSDSPVATMIKAPRFVDNFKEEIIPRLRQVVLQEMDRIKLVQDRRAKGNISEIACFDSKRGESFCFFPFLNNWKNKEGKSFLDVINEIVDSDMSARDTFIDKVLSTYMEDESFDFIQKHSDVVNKLVKTKLADSEEDAIRMMEEYFYNHEYATTQIVQMTVTDYAFYTDNTDFQKRFKEVYASGKRLNTQSPFGKAIRKTVYLTDQNITSTRFSDVLKALETIKKKWIVDGMDKKIANMTVDSIKHKFKEVCSTDAQAYVNLKSFRSLLDMMGAWDDKMEQAFQRFEKGKWSPEDFNIVWQTIKPFVYTQISKESGVGDILIKSPHQNKNSEFLLLAMYQMVAQVEGSSEQLRAIDQFMYDNDIDVVQFESAVKSGKQGQIDITYSQKKLEKWQEAHPNEFDMILDASPLESATDFEFFKTGNDVLLEKGIITQEEYNRRMSNIRPDYKETLDLLYAGTHNADGSENTNTVHSYPYRDFMIAQPNPEHLFDRETNMEAVFGSQFRNIIPADIPYGATFTVNGRTYNKEEVLKLYNALIIENLLDAYSQVSKKFVSIEELQKSLISLAEGNPKYGKNLLDALELIDYTDANGITRKTFNIPIYSPSIKTQIEDLVTSMFKNKITKQHIKGASCVLVSDFGFTDKLHVEYNKNDKGEVIGVKYAECYLPWNSKKFFEPFLREVTENGVTYQVLDIKRVPKELLEGIGYRIPTENKYSIIPLKVIGFLPQQNGSSIMLPADMTTFTGWDFDVDKLFMMLPEYSISYYDKNRAKEDYAKVSKRATGWIKQMFDSVEELDEVTDDEFNEWWKENKENYRLETPKIYKVHYNANKGVQENSRAARNNMLIDISRSIMQNQGSMDKIVNPGSFDNLKLVQKRIAILSNPEILAGYASLKGIIIQDKIDDNFLSRIREELEKESDKSLGKILEQYADTMDPLSLDTFTYYHEQNMVGLSLVSMFANNISMQTKYQGSGLHMKLKDKESSISINGKTLYELDASVSPFGEIISKNCAEMLAAAVDNVKDPVLAKLGINKSTVNIVCTMLRLGMPIEIIGLFLKQSEVALAISMGLSRDTIEDIEGRLPSPSKELNITTDKLYKGLINSEEITQDAADIFNVFTKIVKLANDLSMINSISRFDSPNGAIDTSLGGAKSQILSINKVAALLGTKHFSIGDPKGSILRNGRVSITQSIDELRETLNRGQNARLKAFYSLGVELPMQLMSKFFISQSPMLDDVLTDFCENSQYGILNKDLINAYYNEYIEYMLTKCPLFADDANSTFDQKRDYYLYKFPAKFNIQKEDADFREFQVLKRIRVLDGNIIMKTGGRATKTITESFSNDFDSMLLSDNPKVVKMALDLFIYSFYKNGYAFGPTSFGRFFSPFFLHSIPKFMESLRNIETSMTPEDVGRFKEQFFNNHCMSLVFNPRPNRFASIEYRDPGNKDTSHILVPNYSCSNFNLVNKIGYHKYLVFKGRIYKLDGQYGGKYQEYIPMTIVDDAQGKKYNANMSIEEMAASKTDEKLIEANKKVGAKRINITDLDAGLESIDKLEALNAMDSFNLDAIFENMGDLDVALSGMESKNPLDDIDIEESKKKLDKPFCK